MPSLGEAPSGAARAFGYFGLFKVTRCKSETATRRTRSNGYAPKPPASPQQWICTPTLAVKPYYHPSTRSP